jgi:hypothetical protein
MDFEILLKFLVLLRVCFGVECEVNIDERNLFRIMLLPATRPSSRSCTNHRRGKYCSRVLYVAVFVVDLIVTEIVKLRVILGPIFRGVLPLKYIPGNFVSGYMCA